MKYVRLKGGGRGVVLGSFTYFAVFSKGICIFMSSLGVENISNICLDKKGNIVILVMSVCLVILCIREPNQILSVMT